MLLQSKRTHGERENIPLTDPHTFVRLCRGERTINNVFRTEKKGSHLATTWVKCLKIYFYILCVFLRIFLAKMI